jgi:hypothetical protein
MKHGMRTLTVICLILAMLLTGCARNAVSETDGPDDPGTAADTGTAEETELYTDDADTEAAEDTESTEAAEPSADDAAETRDDETAASPGNGLDGVSVTKESLEDFLALMVWYEKAPYNNFQDMTNPYITQDGPFVFWGVIKMLLLSDQYEKINDLFCFNPDDVNDCARKYFNVDDFQYGDFDSGVAMIFNEETNRYESELNFGIFDEGPMTYGRPVVEQYAVDGDEINVECSVVTDTFEEDGKITTDVYLITLGYENGDYIIRSVSKK